MKRKTFPITKEDGWLVVNTPAVDRDKDRVFPGGARIDNYQKNPVLLWGHNYRDPWAVIGTPGDMKVSKDAIRIKPELREPANESDPMHVIRALWDGGLVRAASIGFQPLEAEENEDGGMDFTDWELLEISLVPVPANQEALRLAVKGIDEAFEPEAFHYERTVTDDGGSVYVETTTTWKEAVGEALAVNDDDTDVDAEADTDDINADDQAEKDDEPFFDDDIPANTDDDATGTINDVIPPEVGGTELTPEDEEALVGAIEHWLDNLSEQIRGE